MFACVPYFNRATHLATLATAIFVASAVTAQDIDCEPALRPAPAGQVCTENVTGQFYYKIMRRVKCSVPFTDTRYRDVEKTCLVYDPTKCVNELVTKTVSEPYEVTGYRDEYRDVEETRCATLTLSLDYLKKNATKCDCDDRDFLFGRDPSLEPVPDSLSFDDGLGVTNGSGAQVSSTDTTPQNVIGEYASQDNNDSVAAEPAQRMRLLTALRQPQPLANVPNRELLSDQSEDTIVTPAPSIGEPTYVKQVSFKPETVVKLPRQSLAAKSDGQQSDSNTLRLVFGKSHNASAELGKHGYYSASTIDQAISMDDNTVVAVSIVDATHVGWGLMGELTLEYESGESHTISNVKANFVSKEDVPLVSPFMTTFARLESR